MLLLEVVQVVEALVGGWEKMGGIKKDGWNGGGRVAWRGMGDVEGDGWHGRGWVTWRGMGGMERDG